MDKQYPLIIVFYLDADLMKQKDIIQPFVESVNYMLEVKNANALAFFLPTTGEERVECINPTVVAAADMEKVNQMIEDIKKNFSVGVPDDIEENKTTCVCGGDNCQCDVDGICACGENCKCKKND